MTAPYRTRTPPPRRHEGPSHPRRLVGILVAALVGLFPASSDACDDPPRYESMMLKDLSKDVYRPGDQIEFKCRPGFKPIIPLLPTSAVCQDDNTWTPLKEACTRKSCPQLELLNGQVSGTFLFGSEAHFVCNEGYELVGSKVLHCELTGNSVGWSGDLPQCEKLMCQPPADITNGKHSGSHKDVFEYNEVVVYSCNPSGGPDEYSLVGESKLVCSGRNVWSSDPPECKVVKCPYPTVKNGRQTAGFGRKYYYKSQVTFECNQGFHLKGSSTVFCGANNEWQPKIPECIEDVKPTIPATTSVTVHPSSVTLPGVKPTSPTTPSVTSHPGSVSLPGVKPTSPTTPPVPTTTDLEHSSPTGEPPQHLGGGIIAVIVLAVVAGIVAICCFVRIVLHRKKKREREASAEYSTYQNKSSTQAEQTN